MTVAYLVNQYPKASHSFIRREIAALEKRGIAVERFTIRPPVEVVDEADRAEAGKTKVLLSGGELAKATLAVMMKRPGAFWRAMKLAVRVGRRSERGVLVNLIYLAEACRLLLELDRCGATHLHAHFGTNSATVAMLCRELGGPAWSFTVHGPEEFDRPGQLALQEKIARAKFAVAISSFGRSQLWRWCAAGDWGKVNVVHCGVDEMFLSGELPAVTEAPRLVCVGRLCEQKGQLLLVEAAGRLKREGVSFELVLVGDGPMRADVERAIVANGLQDSVKITGWMSNADVRREIAASRALVLPSFAEGLPVVIMEALGLGRAVISTYVAGIPELVDERCGWLVPAGDVERLCAAMRAAIEAPVEKLAAMGRVGAERVRQEHDADIEAAKLAKLLA